MKIGFFGTPELSAQVLSDCLEASDIQVSYVVTQPDRPVGRHAEMMSSPVAKLALEKWLPVFRPPSLRNTPEVLAEIAAYEVDFIVVVAYGNILPTAFLELPKYIPINIHGSILPEYRGASPIQTVLLDGRTETGVTIMQMVPAMDAGDILSIQKIQIDPDETSDSLFEKFAQISGTVLLEALRKYERGEIIPVPQNHSLATFTKKFEKEDGKILWSLKTATEIYRQWQACTSWPGIWSTYEGRRCKIISCSIGVSDSEIQLPAGTITTHQWKILVSCQSGMLELGTVIFEWKSKQLAREAFWSISSVWNSGTFE